MDLTDYMSGLWTHNMLDTDKSLNNFLKECVAAPELCERANLTGSTTADYIKSELSNVLNELWGTQETVEVGFTVPPWYIGLAPATRYEDLRSRIFNALYYGSKFPSLDAVLFAAITRNFSAIEPPDLSPVLDRQELMAAAGPHSLSGISCLDSTVRASEARESYCYVEQQQSSSPLADGYIPIFWACPAWGFEAAERYTGEFAGKTKSVSDPICERSGRSNHSDGAGQESA